MANVSSPPGILSEGDFVDGKYRIIRFLGRGAWATVYEGVNARIGRRVAIKVLSEEAIHKPGVVERFEREAQAATRIDSEHVVHVFDLGVLPDGRPYIVMELLEGEDLAHQIASRAPLPERRVVFYAIQALRGLADAHAAGVMHRDIKPDNIVLVRTKQGDEVVKIVDFGISKLHSGAQVTNMTQTNAVLGSPVYMSPEQCRSARHMDHRSDIYSLGVVLFELLTGQLPHSADTFNELMFKIALEDAKSPSSFRPDLDPELASIVVKALARDVNARFQSAVEFEDALVAWSKKHGLLAESWDARRGKVRISIDTDAPPNAGFRATAVSSGAIQVPRDPSRDTNRGTSRDTNRGSGEPTVGPPAKRAVAGLFLGGVALLAVLGGAGVFVIKTRAPARPSASAAVAMTAVPAASELLVEPARLAPVPETPASVVGSPPPSASAPNDDLAARAAAAASQSAAHSAPARRSSSPVAPPPKAPVSVAATPASPPAAVEPAPAPAPAAAPTASSKSVVDGRMIRTEF
ncbi:MAG TPA: serine/threonine-protein kinase [Polyangiaceae bacterium]|nr:serine/threonine-protein kinase [Polyangiaceae bacterium]